MSKHTPGPWTVTGWCAGDSVGWSVGLGADQRISVHAESEESGANARLIAAAPDLLEALKVMVASAFPHPVEHPAMTAAWKVAEAAIEKAEGKS